MRDPDLSLADLVRNREGVFTRPEAIGLGFSADMIDRRCRIGAWKHFDQDVFALTVFPGTWTQRCMAATLIHPAAALSHRTAAVRLGLDGYRPGRIEVVVPPTAHHQSRIATVHRSRHSQIEVVGGIRTCTFAQTMIQLAATEPRPRILAAVSSGIHQRHARTEELRVRMGELRGRRLPGFRVLLDVLDEIDGEPPTASQLERLLFAVLAAVPGMPPVERQAAMPWSPTRTTLVDGFVAPWRLIVEGDGRKWHTRYLDFERDRWRDNEAAVHGLHVMRFGWHRLRHDPEGVVEQVTRYGERFRRAA